MLRSLRCLWCRFASDANPCLGADVLGDIAHRRPEDLNADRFGCLKTMGVETMEVRLRSEDATFGTLRTIRDRVADAGYELHEIMLDDLYSAPAFTLGLPERDAVIDRFAEFVTDLGRLGIAYTTYAWHTGGAYRIGTTTSRGAPTRAYRDDDARHCRTYIPRPTTTARCGPATPTSSSGSCRSPGPPASACNCIPTIRRSTIRAWRESPCSTDAFHEAIGIAGGDTHAGILFCVGTFSEMTGADGKGEDIPAAIREFGASGHIHQVHFRNTSSPLPSFHETLPDNGYVDLVAVMRALTDVGFDGIVVPDHVPGDGRIEEAYAFGYIRALIQAFGG